MIHDLIIQNKEPLKSMLNTFLDTIYDSNDDEAKKSSAPIYENLRKSIIDEVKLTKLQACLLSLLTSHTGNNFKQLAQNYTLAADEFAKITDEICKNLNEFQS